MTNGDQGSALAQEIILAVARAYGWPVPEYREVTLAEVAPRILEEIAGRYRLEGQETEIVVEVAGDHLLARIGETDTLEIYPTSEEFFIALSDGTRIRVERDDGGAVTALQVLGGPRAVRVEG